MYHSRAVCMHLVVWLRTVITATQRVAVTVLHAISKCFSCISQYLYMSWIPGLSTSGIQLRHTLPAKGHKKGANPTGSEVGGKALRDHHRHALTTTPAHCPQTALAEIHLRLCIKCTCRLHKVPGNSRVSAAYTLTLAHEVLLKIYLCIYRSLLDDRIEYKSPGH